MNNRSLKIYAITLNWNSYKDVCECIENLKKSELTLEKIIIIDNASIDGSSQQLMERYKQDKQVNVIHNEVNEGFACAVNIGIKLALSEKATHVFLINNDAIVDTKCLGFLLENLQANSEAGAAAPTVFYHEQTNKIWHGAGYFNYLKTNVVVPQKDRIFDKVNTQVQEVTFLSGCALLIRNEILEVTGLFDPDFFFYGEDVDFSLRVIRQGYKLLYVPNAFAWHKIDNITKSRSSAYVMYHRARSSMIFFRKNFSWLYLLYAVVLHLILYTPFRLWQSILSQTPLKSFCGWIKGTVDGLFIPSRNWVG
jgi:GT2 family glycosyltransferase